MRAIYATNFDLGGASLKEALPVVARWFTYEEPAAELMTNLAAGQRAHELPQDRGQLEVEVLEAEGSRMWTGTWGHPHADDPSLAIVSDATLAEIDGVVSFGLTIQVERVRDELSPVRFQFFAPRLPRDLIERFPVWDGETPLHSGPILLGHADVDRFVDRVLSDPTRQRPVVFISSDDRGTRPPLSPEAVAQDLCGLAHVYYSLYSLPDRTLSRRLGPLGCYGGAVRAGLDMALWDALAQAAGLPLARLLGGTLEPVPAYNSNGLGLLAPDAVAEEALELLAEGGFTALKVRVGRDSPADDVTAVRRVREAVGDAVTLVADYNQGLTLAEALPRCRALDGEGLAWIEEPLRYDDLTGHAHLARDTATPIMLGENFYGPRSMLEAIRAQACDLVMPDLMRIGGVTGWLRAAALAEATGTPMSSHLYPEVSSHLLRVTPTAQWLEWQDWAHPVLAHPFEVRDGHLHLPAVPGNGLEWDEDAVAHHQVQL